MKLEDLMSEWITDSKLDRTNLIDESLKIPQLHSKYYKLYISQKIVHRKLESEHKILIKNKTLYFSGKMSAEELKERGWEPFQFILKSNIEMYLDADQDLIDSNLKVSLEKEKVDFLHSILQSLYTRTFQIKNAVELLKLESGIG